MSSTTGRARRRPRLIVLAAASLVLAATAPAATAHPTSTTRATALAVTLKAPTSVTRGDSFTLRGSIDPAGRATLALQGRPSRTAGWTTVSSTRVSAGRFRFTDEPDRTTWYRVVAERGGRSVHSRVVEVRVTAPVFRWFDLYDLGTTDGDPDGYGMDGSMYAGDWQDEYGYDGFTGEVDATDTTDWATFDLGGRCDRLTGALGASASDGTARVRMTADDGPALVDRAFGDDQWQRLDLDVAAARSLRVDLTHLGGGYLTSYLQGPRVHCDSRLTQRPKDDSTHRWRALYDLGTVDGDPDGFAADGSIYSGDWQDQYGYEGFAAEVSDQDIEDWAVFRVPRGCSRFNTALGATYYGQADVAITDQDGVALYHHELGPDQWHQLDLDLAGVTRLRVTATSLTDEASVLNLQGPRVYCARS